MKERIKIIMEAENLTPSLFADRLKIGRAVMSHILNGRNNPSLDVVTRILETLNYIDADWLLSGKGNMRRNDNLVTQPTDISPIISTPKTIATDLFDTKVEQAPSFSSIESIPTSKVDTQQQSIEVNTHSAIIPPVLASANRDKNISKVIIYYSDNTFQAFNTDSTPL